MKYALECKGGDTPNKLDMYELIDTEAHPRRVVAKGLQYPDGKRICDILNREHPR